MSTTATSHLAEGRLNLGYEVENPLPEGPLKPLSISISTPTNKSKPQQEDEAASTGAQPGDREQWGNPIEFLLSCIAMSVGIGNFYRFPYVAYINGGGAFLIPYLIVLLFIGKPIYFLELSLGQFCSYGQVKCWKLAPFFKGVGYGSTLGSFCVVSYYVSVMALTVFYFFASFQKELPWTKCDPRWTDYCSANGTMLDPEEGTNATQRTNLAQLYFEKEVLQQYDNIDEGIGLPEWRLTLCYLLSWLVVFFSIVKGVQSSGKVAYFTAIYPYVILLVLLVTGLTKEGAIDGIMYFIRPQWDKLYDPKVWYAAISQCFFSLSTGFGPIVMYASFNPFRHNVYRDAMIVSLMDTFTSLLAGFTVFAILGNLAHEMDVEVSEVAKSGPGLVFVSYATAIAKFDYVPQLFAVLFFLMLFSLGVGSAVSWQMAVITVICDQFPSWSKFYVTAGLCSAAFLIGLIYVTPGGQFMLTLVDNFGGNFTIYVLATLEVIGISWVYGLENICKDIEFMLRISISWYWKFCWGFFVPLVLIGILIYSLAVSEPLNYNDVPFPTSAIVCGWLLAAIALGLVPLCALHSVFKMGKKSSGSLGSDGTSASSDLSFLQKVKLSLRPSDDWGPKAPLERLEWEKFKRDKEL